MTTLTLNIDRSVVENAETYAKYTKKTVAQLIEEFLLSIPNESAADSDAANELLGPITRRLTGIIKLDGGSVHCVRDCGFDFRIPKSVQPHGGVAGAEPPAEGVAEKPQAL